MYVRGASGDCVCVYVCVCVCVCVMCVYVYVCVCLCDVCVCAWMIIVTHFSGLCVRSKLLQVETASFGPIARRVGLVCP